MTDSKSRVPPIRKPLEPAAGVRSDVPAPASRGVLGRSRALGGRHSAITRNLQNYASYKSWAEKMRSNWEPGKDPEG